MNVGSGFERVVPPEPVDVPAFADDSPSFGEARVSYFDLKKG